jgi:zinc resistance-associated protein
MDRGAPPPSQRGGAPEDDRLGELDRRLSEIGGNLRLSPDQQRLWAAVEDGVRGVARQRIEAHAAVRERVAAQREARQSGQRPPPRNVPEELRLRAEASAAAAEAMRRLAEATAPLFDSLDDRQRRRFGQIIAAMAQAGRHADTGRRPRRGPVAQQPQGPDDDMDDDEPAGGAPPPRRGR